MQLKIITLFVALVLSTGNFVCAQTSDSTLIIKLLKDDYATMGTLDIQAHVHNVTNDYRLIERGQIWDIETELDSIYRNRNRSINRSDFFSIKSVKVSGNLAYAIWHLRSEFRENGKIVRERIWNESGVFRKEDGYWKIALIHSSLAPHK